MAMHPVLALAWFRAEDYQRVREISDDEMMPTFADFEAKMAKAIPDLEARGIRLQKMIIDPDALLSPSLRATVAEAPSIPRCAAASSPICSQSSMVTERSRIAPLGLEF